VVDRERGRRAACKDVLARTAVPHQVENAVWSVTGGTAHGMGYFVNRRTEPEVAWKVRGKTDLAVDHRVRCCDKAERALLRTPNRNGTVAVGIERAGHRSHRGEIVR